MFNRFEALVFTQSILPFIRIMSNTEYGNQQIKKQTTNTATMRVTLFLTIFDFPPLVVVLCDIFSSLTRNL